MTDNKKNRQSNNVAVFTRNYEQHLARAVERCQTDPHCQVLFRSAKAWATPAKMATQNNPIPIYFVPVDSKEKLITYVARLVRVELDPQRVADDEIRELSVETTQGEGRWGEEGKPSVQTFYFITRCRKLNSSEQIPFTELRKDSDGEPIAENYGYSYVVVQPHPALSV